MAWLQLVNTGFGSRGGGWFVLGGGGGGHVMETVSFSENAPIHPKMGAALSDIIAWVYNCSTHGVVSFLLEQHL